MNRNDLTKNFYKCFFKDATKIQNGRQRSTPKNFVGSKTLKFESEIIQIGDVQVGFSRLYWNSKWPPRTNFNFSVGTKTQKISLVIFFNFNITFLATCGCAIDFLKMLPKFKMAAESQL